ncbi:hypothetical protein [Aeromonas caviae]|uniref:hypothetical protein n=1 Tax=Aeromonas caviae TaxID=648 RepID=UPI00375442D3
MADMTQNNPQTIRAALRHQLYDHVLLAWETKQVQINSARFNKKAISEQCGLELVGKKKLAEIEQQLGQRGVQNKNRQEQIVFYYKDSCHQSLFKSLRDVVAHGHYGQPQNGSVAIFHCYQGPRDKQPRVRIFGQCKVSSLRKLIRFLDTASTLDEPKK